MNCKICSNILTGKQTKFCSIRCKLKDNNHRHQNYTKQKQRGWERKKKFVNLLGGKCSKCGYCKNLSALEFHHQYDKNIKLDIRAMSNNKEEKLAEEIKKCILLCAICHRELHHPEHEI